MAKWGKRRDDLEQTIRNNGDGSMSVSWTKKAKSLDGIALATDEQSLLCSLINQDGTAGPYAETHNLKFFTLSYAQKIALRVNAQKMTPLGRSVLKTLRKKLKAAKKSA